MKGGVYTKERCPLCGQRFIRTENSYICLTHQTRPRRVYIQLYSKELHKYINVSSDSRGNPFSSYEQADRILTKMRAEIDAGSFDPSKYVAQKLKPLRFVNWSKGWVEKKEIEVGKRTKSPSYLKSLRVYIRKFQDYFGDTDIRDIGAKKVEEFYLSLQGSPKYIWNIMSALHKMLSDAKRWEDIGSVPEFPKFEIPEPDIRTIDLDVQVKIINSIPDQMDRTFALFTARLMLRPCETRAVCWGDLDLKHHRVVIKRHFSLNTLTLATKSKRILVRPLDVELEEALAKLPRHISCLFIFQKRGKPYSESYARKTWKKYALQQGTDIAFYQGTRHSSATEAADRVGIEATSEFMGHTSVRTTRRYAKINVNGLRKVLREK